MYYYVIYASSIGLSRLSHEYYDKERLVSKKREKAAKMIRKNKVQHYERMFAKSFLINFNWKCNSQCEVFDWNEIEQQMKS